MKFDISDRQFGGGYILTIKDGPTHTTIYMEPKELLELADEAEFFRSNAEYRVKMESGGRGIEVHRVGDGNE